MKWRDPGAVNECESNKVLSLCGLSDASYDCSSSSKPLGSHTNLTLICFVLVPSSTQNAGWLAALACAASQRTSSLLSSKRWAFCVCGRADGHVRFPAPSKGILGHKASREQTLCSDCQRSSCSCGRLSETHSSSPPIYPTHIHLTHLFFFKMCRAPKDSPVSLTMQASMISALDCSSRTGRCAA